MQRRQELNEMLRCDAHCRFIETAAAKYNLNFTYFDNDEEMGLSTFYLYYENYYRVSAALSSTWIWSPFDQSLISFLLKTDTIKFMYCTRPTRQAFNMLFWTIPFDKYSWFGLGITVLALSALLRGKWIEVITILMRQSSSILNGNKILLLLMLVAIVITCCYESIISCYLTVPLPFILLEGLSDLVNTGYKLLYTYSNASLNQLEEFTQRQNISFNKHSVYTPEPFSTRLKSL